MTTYRLASEMKASGIPWIGDIPATWVIRPVKALYSLTTGFTPSSDNDSLYDDEGEVWVTISDMKSEVITDSKQKIAHGVALQHKRDMVKAGSLLYSFKLSVGAVAFAGKDLYTNEAIAAFQPLSSDARLDFLKYASSLIVGNANVNIYGASIMNQKLILNAPLAIPPLVEQQKIAKFLDLKTAQIDALIDEVKACIEEYKQWKASIIYEAVTKGIDPDAEMIDSRDAVIDRIPKHWRMIKITRILDRAHPYAIGDGDHGLIKPTDYKDSGIPYIRVQNLGWGTDLNTENIVYISEEKNELIKNSTLRPNDILFAKTGATIGKTAMVPENMPIANTTSHVGKISVSEKYSARFIFYVLSSQVGYEQFWAFASAKTTRPELAIDEIKALRLPMPPTLEEQNSIVAYLDAICPTMDSLILERSELIKDLENYKKALIFEVVTGKRKVV